MATIYDYSKVKLPFNENAKAYVGGRSLLDNMYGASSDPQYQMNPPSVARRDMMAGFSILPNKGQGTRRNFSALNYAPINDKNFSAIYGYSSDPVKRNAAALPKTTSKGFTSLGSQMAATGQIGTANKKPSATSPNIMNSLLNYAQSPEGRGFAQGLLEASGYSDMPVSLGQAIARGMQRSNEAQASERANELAKLQMEIDRAKIKPQETFTQRTIEVPDGKGGTMKVPVNVSDLTGKITPVMSGGGTNIYTGQGMGGYKTFNEKFGAEAQSWFASGGYAQVKENILKLDDALAVLENEKDSLFGVTGMIGFLPESLKSVIKPEAVDLADNIRSIVFQSLRETLGAQFTEREGQRLVDASFNQLLNEETNKKRLERLRDKLLAIADSKQQAYEYFQSNNGDMTGYKGTTNFNLDENSSEAMINDVTKDFLNSVYDVKDYSKMDDKQFTDYFAGASAEEQAFILNNADKIPQIEKDG